MTRRVFDFDSDIRKVVSANIKKYRKQKGLTQQDLADLCMLSHEYIRRIESNKSKRFCTIQTIYDISIALEVDIACLFEKEKSQID